MISIIEGKIGKVGSSDKYNFLDVLTASGVGYRVIVLGSDRYVLDKEITLFTSFQVREDNQSLYGFKTESQRDFFELLITVSGIGPKIGVAILSRYSMDEVASFILNKDHQSLSKVSGLGSKGAQKIVVELENRIDGFDVSDVGTSKQLILRELAEALKTLGFSGQAFEEYIKKGEKYSEKAQTLDELIKIVLKEN